MSASAEEIELAVVQTIAAEGFGTSATDPVNGTSLNSVSEAATFTSDAASENRSLTQTPTGTEASAATSTSPTKTPSAISTTPPPGLTPTAGSTPPPTEVPTVTPTPIPPTRAPTYTYTPQPTATEDTCSQISLGGFNFVGDAVSWTVANSGSSAVTIKRIVLNWPSANVAMNRIRFASSTIWNGNDGAPPTDTDVESELKGNRLLLGGASKDLKFEFTSEALGSGYDLDIFFSSACHRSSSS
jgi:hypothetical protein